MQAIKKKGFSQNRFDSRFDSQVYADSVGVKGTYEFSVMRLFQMIEIFESLRWLKTDRQRLSALQWSGHVSFATPFSLNALFLASNFLLIILTSLDIFDFLPLRYRRNIFRFSLVYLIKNHRFNQFS